MRLYDVNYLQRAGLAFCHDIVAAMLAFALALFLRLGDEAWDFAIKAELWVPMLIFAVVSGGVFLATSLYRGIWRYASLNDMTNIVRAATLAVLVFLPITFMVTRLDALPRSSLVITWLLLIFFLAGPRLLYRLLKDGSFAHIFERDTHLKVPVVVVGAGDTAELFIAALKRERHANYEALAVLDDKGKRVGRRIHGVPVLGDLSDLAEILGEVRRRSGRSPQRIVLTKSLSRERLSTLIRFAEENGITLDRLPSLTDFRAGATADPVQPRPVAIEDLLRRPQTVLDPEPVRDLVAGRRVLVTGAGGSIGSELVRQLAAQAPDQLILVEASEFNLYRIDREVGEGWPDLPRLARLCDVRDRVSVDRLFAEVRPELVFHAAALKHVPIVETQPCEGVRTNVGGTRNVADACQRYGVGVMVLVSTDKAVNPTNVMGATKRLAESYCQALDLEARRRQGPRFVTVRFGNVLGSTGSVVPLFQDQLARGRPLTVTHRDMTRYFMTIREAVRLVLQSAALGAGRGAQEAGTIYVLDMGRPVKIVELAEQMIRLGGKRPYKDVDIVFTGLRPGEKLHEELFHDEEQLVATDQPGLRLATPRTGDPELLRRSLEALVAAADCQDTAHTLELLGRAVPEWRRDAAVIPLAPPRAQTATDAGARGEQT